MILRPCVPVVFAAGLVVVLTGCGGTAGSKGARVGGIVTRNGQPVPNVKLSFTPKAGRPSWGVADEEGRFTLQFSDTEDGAEVGRHRVTVDFPPAEAGKKMRPADATEILKQYGEKGTSVLMIEIKQSVRDLEVKLD